MRLLRRHSLTINLLLLIALASGTSLATDFALPDQALADCLRAQAEREQWTKAAEVTTVKCHNAGIQSLQGLEVFHNLETLSLYNNQLREIDINLNQFARLSTINLARNKLQDVKLTGMPGLETLYLFANRIQSLQLIELKQLHTLKANNNRIESFQYAKLPRLAKVYIFNNQLEVLNIYDLPALHYMDCRENPMPDELYDAMDRMEQVTFLHDGNAEDW